MRNFNSSDVSFFVLKNKIKQKHSTMKVVSLFLTAQCSLCEMFEFLPFMRGILECKVDIILPLYNLSLMNLLYLSHLIYDDIKYTPPTSCLCPHLQEDGLRRLEGRYFGLLLDIFH